VLEEVIREELEAHLGGNERRFTCRGPRVMLRSKMAVAFGLVLHELATNAVKHGALSTAEGRVAVEWRVEERDDGRWLLLDWQEGGGPKVQPPTRKGFGSKLIETEIGHDLGGEISTEFRGSGVVITLSVPLTSME
jgi:two-component sensor histidine kinase